MASAVIHYLRLLAAVGAVGMWLLLLFFCDASDEGINQKLSDRALKMDEKGTSDYSEFLDVIYNNQHRLDTLENDLLLLRRDYETLKEENAQLKMNATRLRIQPYVDKLLSTGQFDPRSVTYLQLRRADNALQFAVVTAEGKTVFANNCINPDLLWALRGGGGGTFGVVMEAHGIIKYDVTHVLSHSQRAQKTLVQGQILVEIEDRLTLPLRYNYYQ
ncbi:hypothetical protein HDU86_008345 [Geranomyces michiganensis]|nr:hypothetical protein HDU86_008345 [Geranomyces michiganensis]